VSHAPVSHLAPLAFLAILQQLSHVNPARRPIAPPAPITDRLVRPASQELFLTPQIPNAISVHMQLTTAQLAQWSTLASNVPFVPLAFSSIHHPTPVLLAHPIATTANF
jgi:hypothetical protein